LSEDNGTGHIPQVFKELMPFCRRNEVKILPQSGKVLRSFLPAE
jgi:hypothetical protein